MSHILFKLSFSNSLNGSNVLAQKIAPRKRYIVVERSGFLLNLQVLARPLEIRRGLSLGLKLNPHTGPTFFLRLGMVPEMLFETRKMYVLIFFGWWYNQKIKTYISTRHTLRLESKFQNYRVRWFKTTKSLGSRGFRVLNAVMQVGKN